MKMKQKLWESSFSGFQRNLKWIRITCTCFFVILILKGNTFGNENRGTEPQDHKITGKVTDSSVAPLPGVTVILKGTTKGTITDAEGKYSLTNVSDNATLVFSFVGLKNQEIAVAGKTIINVVMIEESVGIEEVISVGYQTKVKGELTGSVANISGETIKNSPAGNTMKSLQGRLPGVIINDRGGMLVLTLKWILLFEVKVPGETILHF